MSTWQVDFYRRPLRDEQQQPFWELVLCNPESGWSYAAFCPQSQASAVWLAERLPALEEPLPALIQAFRPQAVNLVRAAAETLGVAFESTRRTPDLKQVLRQRASGYVEMPEYSGEVYDPVAIEQPPPMPMPEALWGDRWRFASLQAGLIQDFAERPIPVRDMPESLLPIQLGLASTVQVPGVVIDGGRQSMRLARWLESVQPVAMEYMPGSPDGLILQAGLAERWVLVTFDDRDVVSAAGLYVQRLQESDGLHFLLVQPDDSGVTFSGFWLLRREA